MKYFYLILFILISSFQLKAQYLIKGKVLDQDDNKPINNIQLFIGGKKITEVDKKGNFEFKSDSEQVSVIFKYIKNSIAGSDSILVPGFILVLKDNQKNLFHNKYNLVYLVQENWCQIPVLNEVTVTGYNNNRPISEIPASIATVSNSDLKRFSNTSILPAINTIPGVRMEERSPGSFRLAIRGSSLRSPFGVRNVKIYWNGIPLTDAGGNTYLNLLDLNSIGSIEVIKGPGGSIYGAGTGGVVLLKSQIGVLNKSDIQINNIVGSYGLFGSSASINLGSKKTVSNVTYSHQQADGYRKNSQMRRDIIQVQNKIFASEKQTISVNALYSDLFYQTPGGLTKIQSDTNPQLARLASGPFKSAEAIKAAIYQKIFYAGVSHEYDFNQHWTNKTSLYLNLVNFENPTFTNYEKRDEKGFGGRAVTSYTFSHNDVKGKISVGGEFQKGNTSLKNYGNKAGVADTLQYDDKINVIQYNAFAQAEIDLPHDFYFTIAGSFNKMNYDFNRYYPFNTGNQNRNFNLVFLPRVALLKKINNISLFASVSEGFSPPTIQEIRPSGTSFNSTLNPEKGVNYEIGTRGNLFNNKLIFDATVYNFQLKETIVRENNLRGEYFINAGRTSQQGVEVKLVYLPINNSANFISQLKIGISETYNNYVFKDYSTTAVNAKTKTKIDTINYSGNWITGVAPNIFVSTLDLITKPGFYLNLTLNCTDRIPLNDANTFFSNNYQLLDGKIRYRKEIKKFRIEIFGGINNLLNQSYSLGNDTNAINNRFYNPAPLQNYYGGINFGYKFN